MKIKALLAGLLLIVAFAACTEKQQDKESSSAKLEIRLTDAPGDYDALLLDIQDVQINPDNDDQGWISLEGVEPQQIDLLQLAGGKEEVIASDYLEPAFYNQIRLVLGDDNILVVDGQEIPIKIPSGSTSGLKLNLQKELEAGAIYSVLLDFDVVKSVVAKGNGQYSLKPVIRMIVEETQTGAVRGTVIDKEADAPVKGGSVELYLPDAVEHSASSQITETGSFMIRGVEPGTYNLKVIPTAESKLDIDTVKNIVVNKGMVTTITELIALDSIPATTPVITTP